MSDPIQEALMIANNAIYFDDNSDYSTALYQVCSALGMAEKPVSVQIIQDAIMNVEQFDLTEASSHSKLSLLSLVSCLNTLLSEKGIEI